MLYLILMILLQICQKYVESGQIFPVYFSYSYNVYWVPVILSCFYVPGLLSRFCRCIECVQPDYSHGYDEWTYKLCTSYSSSYQYCETNSCSKGNKYHYTFYCLYYKCNILKASYFVGFFFTRFDLLDNITLLNVSKLHTNKYPKSA